MDMVLENVTFDLPLDSYAGRDIIMWGQPEWIAKGHNAKGACPAVNSRPRSLPQSALYIERPAQVTSSLRSAS